MLIPNLCVFRAIPGDRQTYFKRYRLYETLDAEIQANKALFSAIGKHVVGEGVSAGLKDKARRKRAGVCW